MKVLIVGGGTVGLAAARALAERKAEVTVLERFGHVHEYGSHGGYTRAIRHAYHEGSSYVPMVQEADRLWLELQSRRGETLLVRSGLLELGRPDHPGYAAALQACELHGIEHHRMDAKDAAKRWPFSIPDDFEVCFTPSGGYLRVKACMDAMRAEAEAAGVVFRHGAEVVRLELEGPKPRVCLRDQSSSADAVVVAAGARLPALLPDLLPGGLRPLRRVLLWLRPDERELSALSRLPVWGAFVDDGFFYGFPWTDEGIEGLKLACHTSASIPGLDDPVDPEEVDRSLRPADLAPVQSFVEQYFPRAKGAVAGHRVCLYTATDSWDFLFDRHPGCGQVVVVGGLSGHGFKFAPALGKRVAAMLLDDRDAPSEFRLAAHRTTPVQ